MSVPARSSLDRRPARIVALAVFLLCAAALAYLHRNDFRPSAAPATAAGDDPLAACERDRLVAIDRDLRDGALKPDQADLFRARVDALCRAQQRRDAGGVPPGMSPAPLPGR
jgi:hypothetical protein